MNDDIREYERIEPYCIINRDFAQSKLLSYEAIGLIVQLKSHSKEFTIYKTQLYNRSSKNSRYKIDKIWKELEDNLFLLSFKKRDGSKYSYRYIYSLKQFNLEEIEMLCAEYAEQGYELHTNHKDSIIQNSNQSNQNIVIQNQNKPNKYINSNQKWSAENGLSNINSPKKPVKSTIFELSNIDSRNSTVENQHLINNNIINNNKLNNDLSIESIDSNDKEIIKLDSKNKYKQTVLDEFIESPESWRITLRLQYEDIVPSEILVMILNLSHSYEIAEIMVRNLMTAKTKVDNMQRYDLIIFEHFTPLQIEVLKTKINYIFSRLYNQDVIQKMGQIKNVGAFVFNTYKNYFEMNVAIYQGRDIHGNTRINTDYLPY